MAVRWETAHETQYLFWGIASGFMVSAILVMAANSDVWQPSATVLSTVLMVLALVCIVASGLAKRRAQRKTVEAV